MNLGSIIFAGIGATLAMTIFTDVAFRLLNRPYYVLQVLADMAGSQSTSVKVESLLKLILAIVVHFSIGVLFAYGYQSFAVWVPDWSTLMQGLAYGAFIGVIAVGGWTACFDIHPHPPYVYLPVYLTIV